MKTQILTPFECGTMTKLFSKDRVMKYFEKGIVTFFAGGTGHPYFSTDTTTVLRAIEIEAEAICMENHMPMYVFGLNAEDGIVNAVKGTFTGTKVTV